MLFFEWTVVLLLGAIALSGLARKLAVPPPTLLALGGAALAFIPGAPRIELEPHLALALFLAPILIDAGFDTSLRDIKSDWKAIGSLVLLAVGVTTALVAVVAHALVPELPWAAAVALGAIVAPPDAAAATSILRNVRPPRRIVVILEGESLLNDASALLVYRIAVGAAMSATASVGTEIGVGALVVVASIVVGPLVAIAISRVVPRIHDAPTSILFQFLTTFGVWLLAERVHLSGVLVSVTSAITLGRITPADMPARLRIPSFAVWETVVFVLNVFAFVLVGLQLGPILERLDGTKQTHYLFVALLVLATVIAARLGFMLVANRLSPARPRPSLGGGFVIGWCGMRGIVTLATAFALPANFPYRDLITLTAFVVVLGTLVVQGLTLPAILRRMKFEGEDEVEREVREARIEAYRAALTALDGDDSDVAKALRIELDDAIARTDDSVADPEGAGVDDLRRKATDAARKKLLALRSSSTIGDAAFQRVEAELDRYELTTETDELA